MKPLLWAAVLFLAGCSSGSFFPKVPPEPRVSVVKSTPETRTPNATPTVTPTVTARPTATIAVQPVSTPVPTVPPPATLPHDDLEAPLVRVLLERSVGPIKLPQPGRAYHASWAGASTWLWGPLEVSITSGTVWQVGAFSDPGSADKAEAELKAGLGSNIGVFRETTSAGLIRMRVAWSAGEPAGGAAATLATLGFSSAFAVPGGNALHIVDSTGKAIEINGELLMHPAGEWPTVLGSRRYRGRFRFVAISTKILAINELNMESYLKGVVPIEMGPSQFPELEALKAQAVAARTYAVAHLGDHSGEGYDLCDTPACQAYHGAGAEHSLSSRAVDETSGLIATHGGQPIDAMYTSTCGGHTEDASYRFTGPGEAYLQGVACEWERALILDGQAGSDGQWMSSDEMLRGIATLTLGHDTTEATPQAVITAVTRLCGGRSTTLGIDAGAVGFQRALLKAAGLETAAKVFGNPSLPGQDFYAVVDLFGTELGPPTTAWNQGWHLRAALAALEVQGVVQRDSGEAVPHPKGVAIYPRRAGRSEALLQPLPLFERWSEAYRSLSNAEVRPGTKLERFRLGEQVIALSVQRSGGDGEADRRSSWREWVRERSWSELAQSLGVPDLERIEITERSPSGRVVGLTAYARSGRTKQWSGFPVRRALDLPENLFSFHVFKRPDGTTVVRFLGRGWGHGIGMCQNGSYGLARSGRNFADILKTYYTGIDIVRWMPTY